MESGWNFMRRLHALHPSTPPQKRADCSIPQRGGIQMDISDGINGQVPLPVWSGVSLSQVFEWRYLLRYLTYFVRYLRYLLS